MSSRPQVPDLGHGEALPLALADLAADHGGEPRIHDLTLAAKLGLERATNIRSLIQRNLPELQGYGGICTTVVQIPGTPRGRGRPGREYWLTEGQALVLCALSRTPQAAAVRRQLIAVFTAWRAGRLAPAPGPAPAAVPADLALMRQALALAVDHIGRLQGQLADVAAQQAALAAEVGRRDRALRARLGAVRTAPALAQLGDPCGLFLVDCTRADPAGRVQARPLYRAWTEWCRRARLDPGSETRFGRRLRAAGVRRIKVSRAFYTGFVLREPREWGVRPAPEAGEGLRGWIGAIIEGLVETLDTLDGDPDDEPCLGSIGSAILGDATSQEAWGQGGDVGEREVENEHGGDPEDDASLVAPPPWPGLRPCPVRVAS